MLKIARGYIKGYKKNTVVCILGIAFSVMLMFSLIDMSGRIMNQYFNMMLSTSNYDELIHSISLDTMDEIYDELKSNELEIAKTSSFGKSYINSNKVQLDFIGVEGQWETIFRRELQKGNLPKEDYEVCIEDKFSREMDIQVGEDLEVIIYDNEQNEHKVKFKVSGIVENSTSPSDNYYIYSTLKTAKLISNQEGYVIEDSNNIIYILYDLYKPDLNKLVDTDSYLMEKAASPSDPMGASFFRENISHNEDKFSLVEEEGAYTGLTAGLFLIVVFMFICMCLFIYNTISVQTSAKIRQYGTLRCLGIDIKNLAKVLFYEVLIYAIFGIGIGILLGKVLNYLMADKIINLFIPLSDSKYSSSFLLYILTGILAFLAVIIAVVRIYYKVLKQKPVQMLTYTENQTSIKNKRPSNNLIYDMARRNIKRNKSNSWSLTITISLVTVLIVLLLNLITSIDFSQKSASTFSNLEVNSLIPSLTNEELNKLKDNEDIDDVYWQLSEKEYSYIPDNKRIKSVGLYIYSDNLMEKFLEYNDIEGLDYKSSKLAILVTVDQNITCEKVHILSPSENLLERYPQALTEYDITIDKIIESSPSILTQNSELPSDGTTFLIINEKTSKEILGQVHDYSSFYIKANNNLQTSDIEALISKPLLEDQDSIDYIMGEMGKFNVLDFRYSEAAYKKQAIGLAVLCLYLIASVILLCIFIINNIIKSNFNLRRKEIGMLRSIGGEKKTIQSLMCCEIMVIAIRATIIASIFVAIVTSLYYFRSIAHLDNINISLLGYVFGIPIILTSLYLIARLAVSKCLKNKTTELLYQE